MLSAQTSRISPKWAVRKVERPEWRIAAETGDPTDLCFALTGHSKPQDTTLSTWLIDHDEKTTRDDIVTALILTRHHLTKMDVIVVPMADLSGICDFTFTPGESPLTAVNNRHADMHIPADQVMAVSRIFLQAYLQEQCHRYTKSEVRKLVKTAVQDGKVHLGAVNSELATRIANL